MEAANSECEGDASASPSANALPVAAAPLAATSTASSPGPAVKLEISPTPCSIAPLEGKIDQGMRMSKAMSICNETNAPFAVSTPQNKAERDVMKQGTWRARGRGAKMQRGRGRGSGRSRGQGRGRGHGFRRGQSNVAGRGQGQVNARGGGTTSVPTQSLPERIDLDFDDNRFVSHQPDLGGRRGKRQGQHFRRGSMATSFSSHSTTASYYSGFVRLQDASRGEANKVCDNEEKSFQRSSKNRTFKHAQTQTYIYCSQPMRSLRGLERMLMEDELVLAGKLPEEGRSFKNHDVVKRRCLQDVVDCVRQTHHETPEKQGHSTQSSKATAPTFATAATPSRPVTPVSSGAHLASSSKSPRTPSESPCPENQVRY